ncbi:hypothetical protein QL285_003692 [Trifolium repens]|nr:hypothetical protein QL285_003692 [Trifolium repens]
MYGLIRMVSHDLLVFPLLRHSHRPTSINFSVDSSTLKVFGLAIHLFLQCCETECEQFLRLYCFVSLFRAGLVSPGFPATGRVDVSFGVI